MRGFVELGLYYQNNILRKSLLINKNYQKWYLILFVLNYVKELITMIKQLQKFM